MQFNLKTCLQCFRAHLYLYPVTTGFRVSLTRLSLFDNACVAPGIILASHCQALSKSLLSHNYSCRHQWEHETIAHSNGRWFSAASLHVCRRHNHAHQVSLHSCILAHVREGTAHILAPIIAAIYTKNSCTIINSTDEIAYYTQASR